MKVLHLLIVCLMLSLFLVHPVSAFDPVRPDKSDWTCYDHSISFAAEHSTWGIVSISAHPYFRGISHQVNYRFLNGTLIIYDPMYRSITYFDSVEDARAYNGDYRHVYFHFWNENETPKRYYRLLRDNFDEYQGGFENGNRERNTASN